MKKSIYLFFLLAGIFATKAQNIGIYVGTVPCYYSNATTSVMVTQTVSGAASYVWSATSQNCSDSINTFSNGQFGGITYGCCGSHTITCTALNASMVPISSTATVVQIGCVPSVSITASSSGVCAGNQVILTGSGANNYTWTNGSSAISYSATIAVTPSTTSCYTLIGTTSQGCYGYATKCVSVFPVPNVTISGPASVCLGDTVILFASGAISYTWSNTSLSSTMYDQPLTSTCYTVLGVSANGCYDAAVKCVTVSSTSAVSIFGPSSVCAGNSAVLTVTASGSYTWQPGGITGPSISVTPSVTTCYSVSGSAGNCAASGVKCVSVTLPPTLSANVPSVICSGAQTYFSASGATSYTWLPFNVTGSGYWAIVTSSGCYTLIGSSAGCVGSTTGCYSVAPNPTVAISGNTVICGGSSTTLTATGSTTYTWYPGNMTGSVIVVSPSVSTCYSVSTNSGLCYGFAMRCVTVQNSNISVSGPNSVCSGQSATLTASGLANYTWQPGNLTGATIVVSPTVATCYTVTGTGTNVSCSSSAVKCIGVNQYPVITTGSGGFCSGQSGQILASGATSYTWYPFNLTGSNITVTPTVSGCYTVVGTNSTGCMSSAFGCYSVFPTPSVTVSGPTVVCPGATATLIASGASNYTWIPTNFSGSVMVFSPSVTTCFTVLAGNQNGCTGFATKCVSVQNGSLTVSGPNAVCSGNSVTLTATGAGNYIWQPGNISGASIVVSPVVATCYTVSGTITSGSCQATAIKCVGVGSTPSVTATSGVYCVGQTIVLTAQGASTYTWIPFGLTGSSVAITPTTSGCFSVMGTNSAGCTGLATNCYSVIPAPSVSVSGNSQLCPGDSAMLVASGATSYTWLPGGNTGALLFISPLASTCYTVIASNGFCTSSALKCVQVSATPSVSISGSNFACTGSPYVLTAHGAHSYLWSNGATTSSIAVTPTVSGCFTVTGSNGPNCSASAVKCFSVISSVSLTIGGTHTICRGQLANITVSGANTYKWNTGSTSNVLFVSPPQSAVYTVTGSIGTCSQVRTVQISVKQAPHISISSSHSILCAGMMATLTASGADTFTWLPSGQAFASVAVNPTVSTSFVVNGTDSLGCVGAATIHITVTHCAGITNSGPLKGHINLYPNPAESSVTVQSDSPHSVRYAVLDVLGRTLSAGDFTGSTVIDVSQFANGSYIVQLENDAGSEFQRLIIEK